MPEERGEDQEQAWKLLCDWLSPNSYIVSRRKMVKKVSGTGFGAVCLSLNPGSTASDLCGRGRIISYYWLQNCCERIQVNYVLALLLLSLFFSTCSQKTWTKSWLCYIYKSILYEKNLKSRFKKIMLLYWKWKIKYKIGVPHFTGHLFISSSHFWNFPLMHSDSRN